MSQPLSQPQSQPQSQSRFKTLFEFDNAVEPANEPDHSTCSSSSSSSSSSKKRKASQVSQKPSSSTRAKRKLPPAPPPPRLPDPPLSSNKLWIDEFAPKTAHQLVIHSGKVKQVREWLTSTFKSKPFLAATGPPGTGKLSTVLALAADLDLRILEWVNPLFAGTGGAAFDMDDNGQTVSNAPSIIQSFLDFLSRGTRYSQPSDLLLFRDFPIFSKSGLDRTHAVLASLVRTRSRIPRIVFLFTDFNQPDSDSGHGGGPSSNLECPSTRDIFPTSCLHAVHTIAFNPVAPTLMKKALKRILADRRLASTSHIDSIIQSSHGDLRAAINTLQFAHLSPAAAAAAECTSDQSRSLFRAVGRCMYAQRIPPPKGATPAPLPQHLHARWARADPLEVDPAAILTNLAVSSDLFAMYLHANYPEYIKPLSAHVFVADAFVDADRLQRAGRAGEAADFVRVHALALARGMGEDELDRDLSEVVAGEADGIDWDDFDDMGDDEGGDERVRASQEVVDALVLGVNWDEFDSHPNEAGAVAGLPTPESGLSQQQQQQHEVVYLDCSPEPPDASLSQAEQHQPAVSSTPPTSQPPPSEPALPPTALLPSRPPLAPPTKPASSGNRFQALISSDHWTARRAYMDRSCTLARLGIRPEEAPFAPVFSNPNRRAAGKLLTESAAAGAGEEAKEEALAPRLMTQLPDGKSKRWYLCAARRRGVPPWIDAGLGGVASGGVGEGEEEEDEIVDV